EELIRGCAGYGRAVGTRAGVVWSLTLGLALSTMIGWVLGKYGYASLVFVLACTGVSLPLAMGLGAALGHLAAATAARDALLRGEGRWGRAVWRSRRLLGILLLCFTAGAVAVETLTVLDQGAAEP